MSEIIIHTRNLTKVYRLYASPRYRFLDMFGLLRRPAGAYTEHAALDGVSLDIRRGEKVAFIGRNGAGKSTLLKLLTGVIEPTAGVLDVKGKAHALLQIGSGFHPDFTGRENVYAYLAQLGVTGTEADRRFAEIVEFAELEEYIGQPVKTYSSGMAVRLMFSTSTAIVPDLLVLDEVLGVGDAYFAQKSYERIRALCAGAGSTLLLVTHDVYTAAKVCSRMVWIDRGRILIDGEPTEVISAYEDSVRQQEERRLRLRRLLRSNPGGPQSLSLMVEARALAGRPLPAPVYFSRFSLGLEGTIVDSLPVGAPESGTARLVDDVGAWGEPITWHGAPARPWNNYGTVFHKVAGTFDVSGLLIASQSDKLAIEVECWCDQPCTFQVIGFLGEREINFGTVTLLAGRWTTVRLTPAATNVSIASTADAVLRLGSGRVVIGEMKTLDADRRATAVFSHGRPFVLSIEYQVNDPNFSDEVQVLASFHRDGAQDVCRMFCQALRLSAAQRHGTIEMRLPAMPMGSGTYTVSVGITELGYFDRQQTVFYSINPGMYDCVNRGLEIEVIDGGVVGSGTGCVIPAEWVVEDRHRNG